LRAGTAVVLVSVDLGFFDSSRSLAGFASGMAHSPFQSQTLARRGAGRRKGVARSRCDWTKYLIQAIVEETRAGGIERREWLI